MSFRLSLATEEDEAAIRRLLRTNSVPGHVTVTYEREPDFFLGCGVTGGSYQVVVARHEPSGELAGVVCRARRQVWINGQEENVGYLSGVRVDERFRGRWLVPRGLRFLGELDATDNVQVYLATITGENREARGLLVEKPRRGFPRFEEAGRIYTAVIPVRKTPAARDQAFRVRLAVQEDLPRIVSFLNQQGRFREYSQVYSEEDFRGRATLGFSVEDFVVFERDGGLSGVAGLWDQSAYKQTVVRGYSGGLRLTRPLYDVAARLTRRHSLPAPGEPLRSAYAAFVCVAGDDRLVFRALLKRVHDLAAKRGHSFLVAGLAANDPLLAEVRRYAHVPYHSTLYTVTWRGGLHATPDGRIPHVEVATL
ncbi:MAG: hypothetical protein H0U55_16830 [Rubrobacteraceae bacterium]|nr:hypothetical protein [Rubrobacteraceae bacterium]